MVGQGASLIELLTTWLTRNWIIAWISWTLILVALTTFAPELAFYLAVLTALAFLLAAR